MNLISLLPIVIVAFGLFFLIKLKFFFVIHPIKTGKAIAKALKKREAFKSLSLALAGTLGVGNIVGVAFGISVGGAGSLFWIFISSFFASVIKYCESLISSDMKFSGHGGMMYVIKASFKRIGIPLSKIYAILCLLLSFFMGAALQSNSAVNASREALGISPSLFSVLFTTMTAVVILTGSRKIDKLTAVLIPAATLLYIILCIGIISFNIAKLPEVISDVISSAFSLKSIGGGVGGSIMMLSLREGFARGLLSNEAGAGTSAMAQSRSEGEHPSSVGLLGMCEVFFDTSLLCMLTGLSVLLALESLPDGMSGMYIVISAAQTLLPSLARPILSLIIFLFAYSTVICWYFYGSECVFFLAGRERSLAFSLVFLFSVFFGFFLSDGFLISLSDYLLFLMTILTLTTLMKKSERILHLSERLLKNSDIGENGEA